MTDQKTKSWSLTPSLSLPELQWAPEETIAASVGLQSRESTAPRTEETAFKWQMHTIANSSDRGGDTKVKQLRSDSHHYWEENNATITPAASPNPFTHSQSTQAVHGSHPGHPRQRSTASDHWGSTKNSGALQGLTTPLPTTLCHEDQCYLVTEEILASS